MTIYVHLRKIANSAQYSVQKSDPFYIWILYCVKTLEYGFCTLKFSIHKAKFIFAMKLLQYFEP